MLYVPSKAHQQPERVIKVHNIDKDSNPGCLEGKQSPEPSTMATAEREKSVSDVPSFQHRLT